MTSLAKKKKSKEKPSYLNECAEGLYILQRLHMRVMQAH